MALIADLGEGGVVVEVGNIVVGISHEGRELTVGDAILVSQRDVELVERVAIT